MIEEKDDTYLLRKILIEIYDHESAHFRYLNSKTGYINSVIQYTFERYDHYLKLLVMRMDELGLYHLKANSFERGEDVHGNFSYGWTASRSEKKRFENYLRTIIPSYNIRKTRALLKYASTVAGGKRAAQMYANYMEEK